MNTSYTAQDSVSSIESNDSEISSSSSSSSSSLNNAIQNGPIQVLFGKRIAPTLEMGRRSKYLVLEGEEAVRREKQRERNRNAARKLKEKRLLIEEELNQKLKELEDQNSDLENYLEHLKQRKHNLQEEVDHLLMDSIDELIPSSFIDQYSDDLDLFDETIQRILNPDQDISFSSITHN